MAHKRIGEFLVEKGLINEAQLPMILSYAQRNNLRFGDAALALKLFSRERLIEVFGPSFKIDFFHLDPAYYPISSKNLFSTDEILQWGALPLGYKTEQKLFKAKRLLNVGLLDPANSDHSRTIEAFVKNKLQHDGIAGIKVFLIIADQYLDILRVIYGLSEEQIRSKDPKKLDATLQMFLEQH